MEKKTKPRKKKKTARKRSATRLKIGKKIVDGELELPDGYQVPGHAHGGDSFTTVRESNYRCRAIRVETTYRITIDGEPLKTHTMVMDDGSIMCHGLPNYTFPSAVEMVQSLVDATIEIDRPEDELGDKNAITGGHH